MLTDKLISGLRAIISWFSGLIMIFLQQRSRYVRLPRQTYKYSSPILNALKNSPTTEIHNHLTVINQEVKPVDMREIQINMEKLFHKNQLIPRIKSEFVNSQFDFRSHMHKHNIDTKFGFDLLVQMVLHKRTTLPVLVGILRRHFTHHQKASQITADEILKCTQADLVDWHPSLRQFIVKYDISPDVQEDLDRYQYPLPMVVEPKEIKDNTDTGYYTSTNSVILKNNHHDDDVCLDHLNKMNNIKLKINHTTAVMIHNQWKHLDKPKQGEERKDFQRRVKAFEKYDRTARDVMAHLEVAGNEFYITHKYDKRGRVYSQGYHVNYQGNDWNKAVIEFSNEEIVQ